MPDGGCYCGNVRYRFTGDIQAAALCHCRDCQKISGSTYSTNIIVPGEGFEVTNGKAKAHTTTADSGNPITSHFCDNCGSVMFRDGPTFGDGKVIKVGTLDAPEGIKPGVELYVPERAKWIGAVDGAAQKKAMPDSADV